MLGERLTNLLSLLSQDEFQTAESLSGKMQLSVTTLRRTVRQLNKALLENGAHIETERGKGYLLKVDDFERFQLLFLRDEGYFPDNSGERVKYLLEYFLTHDEYVKSEELCDMLYVSKRTLAADLKKAEQILEQHEIEMERKPYYGMRITGDEFHIRQCIAMLRGGSQGQLYGMGPYAEEEARWIAKVLQELLEQESFQISDIALQNLVIHIYVAVKRIQGGQYVPLPSDDYHEWISEQEYRCASKLACRLEQKFQMEFPREEIIYIAIHFAGKGREALKGSSDNLVISNETVEIVQSMLEEIYQAFQIDLREDLELSVALGRHIGPLKVRLQYGMHLKNPILEEIRKRYSFAYVMASQAGAILSRYFRKLLDPDEIAYIALALELALERQRTHKDKKNILLVCASGAGTARLLAFKMQDMFHDCIGEIRTCDEHSVKYQDFDTIDYIFTTVPIHTHVPVPISEMKLFLGGKEIAAIRGLLKGSKKRDLMQFYPEELFFSGGSFQTKQEIIRHMCREMERKGWIPDGFYQAVMKREEIGYTCMDNHAAMPHPYEMTTEKTFVAICVLDKPVEWIAGHFVQAVFLMSASQKEEDDLKDFYATLARLILDKENMAALIEKKDYHTLKRLIEQMSEQEEEHVF